MKIEDFLRKYKHPWKYYTDKHGDKYLLDATNCIISVEGDTLIQLVSFYLQNTIRRNKVLIQLVIDSGNPSEPSNN